MTRDDAIDALTALHETQGRVDLEGLSKAIRGCWPTDFGAIFTVGQDLTARPCELNPRDYHLRELARALDRRCDQPSGEVAARIRYHAQWLLFLGAPGPGTSPKVSLLIPIYNRAWAIDSLVANCLQQTYANIELVFVNDGSTDGTLEKLRGYGDRIKLVSQENKGVSAARNAGIAAASGELIHFLDSDNLLHPDHVAEKVQAFATVPDAQHCYCRAVEVALFGAAPQTRFVNGYHAEEGELSPTDGLLTYILARGYPFLVTASTVPRHTLLAVAPAFDEDLRRSEDARLWFRLGAAGIKTMRLARPLFYRIRMTDGLHEQRHVDNTPFGMAVLRGLLDLLSDPDHWPQALLLLTNRRLARRLEGLDGVRSPAYEADFQKLLQAIARLPQLEAQTGTPALPVLITLAGFARHQQKRAKAGPDLWKALSAAVAKATGETGAWHSLNVAFWKDQRLDLSFSKWFFSFLSASPFGLSREKVAELDLARDVARRAAVSAPAVARSRRLVTFVVPVCDRPAEAAMTIRSVLAQRMSSLAAIIVVDSDRTRLPAWRQLSPSVAAFHAETFSEAHAVALDARQTIFMRFLRPGDRLRPNALGKQLIRAGLSPTRVLVETDALPRAASFDRLPSETPLPPLSSMWFPKWIMSEIGGFDVVLGNAFEKRYGLRLRAGRVPFKSVAVLTEWSDFDPKPDGPETTRAAVSSLILALRNEHLWKCIPGLFDDLASSRFAGESEPGTLLHRTYEILRIELSSLAQSADRRRLLGLLVSCLVGMTRRGVTLPREFVELKAVIELEASQMDNERPKGI